MAIAPLPAQGDTICPKGTKNPKYCTKKCVVPQLKGKSQGQANTALKQHDCTLGKVTKANGSGVPKGKVLRSSPGAGTQKPAGFAVNIVIRK